MNRPPFRLTPEQYELLLQAIADSRIGKNAKGFSHVEAWDVRRWLVRIFGFGSFDIETIELAVVREIEIKPMRNGEIDPTGKSRWTVVYRAQVRLTVRDQFGGYAVLEDGACGDSSNQPALGDCHDNASKTALSQALKRCAVNLGDQFGLSLYNGGSPKAVVLRSLVSPDMPKSDTPAVVLPADDAPVMPEPGMEPATDEHPTAAAPATPAAEPRPAPTATVIRDWVLQPGRTTTEILNAQTKLRKEHRDVAKTELTNEHGDNEPLDKFMSRRARELAPAAAQPAVDEDKRRKRMFALFRDLGFSGDANREQRRKIAAHVLGREITSMTEVTGADQEQVITALEDRQRGRGEQHAGAAA